MNPSAQFLHDVPGLDFTDRYCSRCIWYNWIQSARNEHDYTINCAMEECTKGQDIFNRVINLAFTGGR